MYSPALQKQRHRAAGWPYTSCAQYRLYVYMYLCVYVCMYAAGWPCTSCSMCMYICICACMCACSRMAMQLLLLTHTHTQTHTKQVLLAQDYRAHKIHTYIHAHTHARARAHMCTHTYARTRRNPRSTRAHTWEMLLGADFSDNDRVNGFQMWRVRA